VEVEVEVTADEHGRGGGRTEPNQLMAAAAMRSGQQASWSILRSRGRCVKVATAQPAASFGSRSEASGVSGEHGGAGENSGVGGGMRYSGNNSNTLRHYGLHDPPLLSSRLTTTQSPTGGLVLGGAPVDNPGGMSRDEWIALRKGLLGGKSIDEWWSVMMGGRPHHDGSGRDGADNQAAWEGEGSAAETPPTDFMYTPGHRKGSTRMVRPARIIVVRHGESLGNIDESTYCTVPDWKVPLTLKGIAQAEETGREIAAAIGGGPVYFYTSPYLRTKQTLAGLIQSFETNEIVAVREEPRLCEQQFGNFQQLDQVLAAKKERAKYGRFYYRFPNGESGFDVYTRISTFLPDLYRDAMNAEIYDERYSPRDLTMVVVTHGLTLRLLMMRWLQFTISDFESSINPHNAGFVLLERRSCEDTGREWYQLTQESLDKIGFPRQHRYGSLWKLMTELPDPKAVLQAAMSTNAERAAAVSRPCESWSRAAPVPAWQGL